MNRRSMFKAIIGACAGLLFPWRKVKGADIKVDPRVAQMHMRTKSISPESPRVQIRRIEGLLKRYYRDEEIANRKFYRQLVAEGNLTRVGYDLTVKGDGCSSDVIQIWLDGREPDKDGQYGCGLILLTDSLAASMNDDKLLRHLADSLAVALTRPYLSHQCMFEEFKGKPVLMKKGEVIGAEFNKENIA